MDFQNNYSITSQYARELFQHAQAESMDINGFEWLVKLKGECVAHVLMPPEPLAPYSDQLLIYFVFQSDCRKRAQRLFPDVNERGHMQRFFSVKEINFRPLLNEFIRFMPEHFGESLDPSLRELALEKL